MGTINEDGKYIRSLRMSNSEPGFREEQERKHRRNTRLVFALFVIGMLAIATSAYLKVEWSGRHDRRTRRGRIAKTDV